MFKKCAAFFALFSFFVCTAQTAPAKEVRALAATFPVYLFTRNVVRDCPHVRVDLLIPAGTGCPHEYTLTPRDLHKLSNAQIILQNGLGIDASIRADSSARSAHIIDCSSGIQVIDGNPHLFAGPEQAAQMVKNIAEGLAAYDYEHAEAYATAANAYAVRLLALSARLSAAGSKTKQKGVVLQHDALAYIAHNAGLRIAAFIQEDEDAYPSAARLVALADQIKKELPAFIASDTQYSDKPVQTLSRETGVPAVRLDSVASGPADAPLDYYESVMNGNCKTLETYFDQH